MSKHFVFGFDGFTPRGGMLDLLTVLELMFPPFAEEKDITVSAKELKSAVAAFRPLTHYQVLHLVQDGGVLHIEHWRRSPAHASNKPSDEELTAGTAFMDTDGSFVRREAIQPASETSVGYIPE